MSKVAIVTDSTAAIPDELLEALNIHWVPYYIHRGNEVLRDLINIKREAFYRWLPWASEIPKTANPGPGDYETMYEQLAEQENDEIISIHMSSKGSGAFQAALIGKELTLANWPNLKIEIIDTLNVSMCLGWITIEAARAALTGKSMDEILTRIRQMMPVTQMIQTADTLKYLFLGGRIGRAQHLMGSLLNIKPLISMQDGVIVSLGQAFTRKKAYQMMVDKVVEKVGEGGKIKIAFVHAAAREEAEKIKMMFEERLTCVETIFAELPPALGVHTGPGTAGICFFPVDE